MTIKQSIRITLNDESHDLQTFGSKVTNATEFPALGEHEEFFVLHQRENYLQQYSLFVNFAFFLLVLGVNVLEVATGGVL